MKVQGGTTSWESGATATTDPTNTGTLSWSGTKKNPDQVLTWTFDSLSKGASASVTVTVTGTAPSGTTCGSALPISGTWSASGLGLDGNTVHSSYTGSATIAVTCT
jgi:hypothetical protein